MGVVYHERDAPLPAATGLTDGRLRAALGSSWSYFVADPVGLRLGSATMKGWEDRRVWRSAPLRARRVGRRVRGLEEGANRLALDAQADHATRAVDVGDRLGRHELAPAEKGACADGQSVGLVGRGTVHRALDAPY